jgi:pyruvate dehydrogenase E1 component alpha subunit
MHLFAPEYLAASSGIVGASGPAAAGFALAGQYLRPGTISVAFFGEGATNQGMLLESFNLAAAWQLPVLFVCKDNAWEITTQFSTVSYGGLAERARSFGVTALDMDGSDVQAVWEVARQAIQQLRQGGGPFFMHASCVHLHGHFLGDQLMHLANDRLSESNTTTLPMVKSFLRRKGAPWRDRLQGVTHALTMISHAPDRSALQKKDPLISTRLKLETDPGQLQEIEAEIQLEIQQAVQLALSPLPTLEGSHP